MSWAALAWAGKCKPGSASMKLVLLALADRHNEEAGLSYPSVDWLVDFSGLNRKTVMNALDGLERGGFICDSGRRVGRTGQIKAYWLELQSEGRQASHCHYLYRLTAGSGEYYLGVRTCVGDPADDAHMGSGNWPSAMRQQGEPLKKEVLSIHTDRLDAQIAEALEIKASLGDPLCMNVNHNSPNITVPKTAPLKSPTFSAKESQNRDTEPSSEPSPPSTPKGVVPPAPEIDQDSGSGGQGNAASGPGEGAGVDKPVDLDQPDEPPDALRPEHVVQAWNGLAGRLGLVKVVKLTAERRKKLNARIRDSTIDEWKTVLAAVERSAFLRGDNPRGWRADFDFLIQPKSFTKILEGSYDE